MHLCVFLFAMLAVRLQALVKTQTGPEVVLVNGQPAAPCYSRSGHRRALATEPSTCTALVLDPGDGYPEGSPEASTGSTGLDGPSV